MHAYLRSQYPSGEYKSSNNGPGNKVIVGHDLIPTLEDFFKLDIDIGGNYIFNYREDFAVDKPNLGQLQVVYFSMN